MTEGLHHKHLKPLSQFEDYTSQDFKTIELRVCNLNQLTTRGSGVKGSRIKTVNTVFMERSLALYVAVELSEGTGKCKGINDASDTCIWESPSVQSFLIVS